MPTPETNIAYVCLSDLHLGEEDSLLTAVRSSGEVDATRASRTLKAMVECLRELLRHNSNGRRPTLILNGDIVELALANVNEALLVFGQFMSQLMQPDRLVDRIIYIPGNHDHHFWEFGRENQYLRFLRKPNRTNPLEPPWHTTKMIVDAEDELPAAMLTAGAQEFGGYPADEEILLVYPNFGLWTKKATQVRLAAFHHGHLLEGTYRAVSAGIRYVYPDMPPPANVYELEEENFAWIDFLWSALGRSGSAGKGIETIYEATKDSRRLRSIADGLAKSLADKHGPWPDIIEVPVLKRVLRHALKKVTQDQERRKKLPKSGWPLSDDAVRNLSHYVRTLVMDQLVVERTTRDASGPRIRYPIPDHVTFVFGHTHKPFADVLDDDPAAPIPLLNSGGWVVDGMEAAPSHGGAIVLLDESLDAVLVQMYKEEGTRVNVIDPAAKGQQRTALFHHVNGIVDPKKSPWKEFSSAVESEIARKRQLKARS